MPEADGFYLANSNEQLSQGDLYLVPTSMIWSQDSRPDALAQVPALPPRVGSTVITHAWDPAGGRETGAPATAVETRWSPAMVLSHNCEIDKDFNEEVDRLVAEGAGDEEAIQHASRDWALDLHITVSPLLAYDERSPPTSTRVSAAGRGLATFPCLRSRASGRRMSPCTCRALPQ